MLERRGKIVALEVKSNGDTGNTGLSEFKDHYSPLLALVIGDGGMSAEDFLSADSADLFK